MLNVSQQPSQSAQRPSISFAPEVNTKEEQRAIRKDKEKVTKLLLQSDVAFVVDKSYALKLLEEAKVIIFNRFSNDKALIDSYSNRKEWFKEE